MFVPLPEAFPNTHHVFEGYNVHKHYHDDKERNDDREHYHDDKERNDDRAYEDFEQETGYLLGTCVQALGRCLLNDETFHL